MSDLLDMCLATIDTSHAIHTFVISAYRLGVASGEAFALRVKAGR